MLSQAGSVAAIIVAILAAALPAQATWATKLGITEAQARREMIGDGYTKVQNLHKANKGWTATALEGGKPVTLLVNERGDVLKTR